MTDCRRSLALGYLAHDSCPRVVLDTQVVLDWLVFRDPGCMALSTALENNSVCWLTSQAMRNELEHVLGREAIVAWKVNRIAITKAYERCAQMVTLEVSPNPLLRCTDPDDQMFIDLALSTQARCLFTRDRALLKLARRAKQHGVTVLQPADWPQHMEAELS